MPERAKGDCPACRKILSASERGARKCQCGAILTPVGGVKGTGEVESLLESRGFHYASDYGYYLGPLGHIVQLYDDGTWESDKAPAGCTLANYLAGFSELNSKPRS